ncbi:MAG: hypothetical protein R2853_02480 [Thermomicrobiales bacterium]|nr:hypothetical protein [Thermomicrobiales bacterium]
MNRIDDSPEWSPEGLGIAIRMQHGDFGRESRPPVYLRVAAVLLSVTTLAILLGVAGWYAWRSLARRNAQEAATPDTPGVIARG